MADLLQKKDTPEEKKQSVKKVWENLREKMRNLWADAEMQRRRKRSRSLREVLMLVVPAVALVIAATMIWVTLQNSGIHDIGKNAVHYYNGSTNLLPENGRLQVGEEGTVKMIEGKSVYSISDLPIYYTDRRAVLLPVDMLYYCPREEDPHCAPQFCEIECDESGNILLKTEKEQVQGKPGFLYNGKDFYLFLEPVEVKFNGYRIALPAMSYVEAIYGGHVMTFNYETKEFITEPVKGEIIATAPGGDYTVSLLNDVLTTRDDTRRMLSTRPDFWDPILK